MYSVSGSFPFATPVVFATRYPMPVCAAEHVNRSTVRLDNVPSCCSLLLMQEIAHLKHGPVHAVTADRNWVASCIDWVIEVRVVDGRAGDVEVVAKSALIIDSPHLARCCRGILREEGGIDEC